MFKRTILTGALLAFVAGCTGNSASTPITPPSVPLTVQHLYVANNSNNGQIVQYSLPLSASSVPNFGFTASGTVTLALDPSGDVIAGDPAGNLHFFPAPLSAASSATAAFAHPGNSTGAVAFTQAGDFFVSSLTNRAYEFTHPFSNASVPSAIATAPTLVGASGVAVDSASNLYVANAAGAAGTNLYVFAAPYTGAPTAISPLIASKQYAGLALSATQLFVVNSSATNSIDVYNLPITAASAPVFSITNGIPILPSSLAFDSAGNLYLGSFTQITEYSPPFSAASTPVLSLPVPATFEVSGIAIGT